MTPQLRAFLRLFLLQASWTYERMQGIGIAFAAEPLLEDFAGRSAALGRATEFFNGHPVLAGVAVGASVRAERDGVAAEQVRRLKGALSGPLGSLGDRLFWAGTVPALAATGVALAARGAGLVAPAVVVLGYGLVRGATQWWALRTGLEGGLAVGGVIRGSWLPRAAERAPMVAAVCLGLALPLAARQLMGPLPGASWRNALLTGLVVLALAVFDGARFTPIRTAFALGLAVLLARGISG